MDKSFVAYYTRPWSFIGYDSTASQAYHQYIYLGKIDLVRVNSHFKYSLFNSHCSAKGVHEPGVLKYLQMWASLKNG
jgi:hypothetical protein